MTTTDSHIHINTQEERRERSTGTWLICNKALIVADDHYKHFLKFPCVCMCLSVIFKFSMINFHNFDIQKKKNYSFLRDTQRFRLLASYAVITHGGAAARYSPWHPIEVPDAHHVCKRKPFLSVRASLSPTPLRCNPQRSFYQHLGPLWALNYRERDPLLLVCPIPRSPGCHYHLHFVSQLEMSLIKLNKLPIW